MKKTIKGFILASCVVQLAYPVTDSTAIISDSITHVKKLEAQAQKAEANNPTLAAHYRAQGKAMMPHIQELIKDHPQADDL